MEFLDFIIIVPIRKVLLLEVFLELFSSDLPFTNLLYLLVVLLPNGCSSIQVKDGNPCLHVSWIVLYLEILLDPKKPSFIFLTSLYLTIKGRRYFLFKFIPWTISIAPPPLISMRWRAWIPSGSFRVRRSTTRPSFSSGTALATFWFFCLMLKVHLLSNVCQAL